MSTEQLALVRGWADTRATLRRWNARPLPIVGAWARASFVVALGLLTATWAVAVLSVPEPLAAAPPGTGSWDDFRYILYRNGLVLALHALACLAGFMAGSSLPIVAEGYAGWWRKVHDKAGKIAMAFVAGATVFSLATQALALGLVASSLADAHGVSPAFLLLSLTPHAIPELSALFLPLAAWLLASRRGAWDELLAATFVTTAVAVPIVVASAAVEVWVSPHVLYFLK